VGRQKVMEKDNSPLLKSPLIVNLMMSLTKFK